MVAVAADHFSAAVQSVFRESFVTEVLPAEDRLQNEDTVFVAGIQKSWRGGVMRGADVVKTGLLDLPGIAPLGVVREGVADVGILLMTVYTSQEAGFTIQTKSFGCNDDLPYAEARLFPVDTPFPEIQFGFERIECRGFR